jgi:hypothetical protein
MHCTKKLEDLVLKHTQVCIRADGEVHKENDKITFRTSSTLERDERYNYLLSRLTLKPRRPRASATAKQEEVPARQAPPTILRRDDDQVMATPNTPSQKDQPEMVEPPTLMEGIEQA